MNASMTVVAAAIVITGSTIIRRTKEGSWKQGDLAEVIIFGYLLAIALLVVAIIAPPFAKALGYLGLVGAFIVNGPAIADFLGDLGRDNAGRRGVSR